jgi:CheY-like chemotaxis protein
MGRRLAEVTLVIVYHCGSKQSFGVLTSRWPVQKRSRNPLNAFHIATQIQVRPLVFGEPALNIGMYPSTLGRLGIWVSAFWKRSGGGRLLTRILVADDCDVVRRGIKYLLRQHADWEVCGEAVDGQEAVEKARQLSPDLVLLDYSMPVLNGIEAARRIQEMRPSTRFVLCSMYMDSQLASIAREVGITSVLSKSNVGQVVKSVEAGLQGKPFAESRIWIALSSGNEFRWTVWKSAMSLEETNASW